MGHSQKKMFTNNQLIIWNGNVYANDNPNLNVNNLRGWSIDEKYLMQFTGLKDKNGKEIFEGDIVRYILGKNTFTEVITYNKDLAGFGFLSISIDDDYVFTLGELIENLDLSSIEVIGNIYENPELLETM